MKKILQEAIINEAKRRIAIEILLKETLRNPIFNKYRKFENELEVELLYEMFGSPPTVKGITPGGGAGPGIYGVATPILGELENALKAAKFDDFNQANEVGQNLENILSKVKPVVDLLEDGEEVAKVQANVLLAKLYTYLKNMLTVFVEGNQKLQGILPKGWDEAAARKQMAAAAKKAREAEEELEAQEKPGFKTRFMKAFSIKEQKKKLNEGLMSTLLSPGHNQLDKYTSKVDAFIDDSIETCDKLIKESEDLLEEDFYRLPQAGERSRLILEMVGLLKKYKCDLENIPWQLRQRMG